MSNSFIKPLGVPQLATLMLAGMLAACGGGGSMPRDGGLSVPPPPPPADPVPPSDPQEFRTAEYDANWGLDAINAADAYAKGYTGAGVKIGIIDFNFNFDSDNLNFDPASTDADPAMKEIYEAQIGEPASTALHGQAVAEVAAGQKNDNYMHGVAFDAEVIAIDYFSGVNSYQTTQNGILYTVSDPWTYAIANGARVVNKSLGYDEGDILHDPPSVSESYALDYDVNVIAAGGLLVTSAGNNADPEPSLSVYDTISLIEENGLQNSEGAFIIAGAVDENLEIADFSDRAGSAMDYYLVAPGVDIVSYWEDPDEGLDPGYYFLGGTSFSAPFVTGAAALLFQRWPELSAREVADILFDTATDLGDPGVDEIYGNGLLNLNAALTPQGQVAVAVKAGKTIGNVRESSLALGPAFGDTPALMSLLSSVTVFDKYNRDFQMDMTSLVGTGFAPARLFDRLTYDTGEGYGNLWFGRGLSLNYTASTPAIFKNAIDYLMEQNKDWQQPQTVQLHLSGTVGTYDWSAGRGYGLTDVLSDAGGRGHLAGLYPYGGSPAEFARGNYMTSGLWLDETRRVTLGVSFASNDVALPGQFNPFYPETGRATATAAMMQYDRVTPWGRLSLEAGFLSEAGQFLGARSAGALTMAQGGETVWTGFSAHIGQGDWVFTARVQGGLAQADLTADTLFQTLSDSLFTVASAKISKHGTLVKGDIVTFGIAQPMRIERSVATLNIGTGRDPASYQLTFGELRTNLTPSGREIRLEGGYGVDLSGWRLNLSGLYRRDAGHIAGLNDAAVLMSLKSVF